MPRLIKRPLLPMADRIAILAGAGRFPFAVAQEARHQGIDVVALGIESWVDSSLAGHVNAYEEVAIGQVGRLIDRLKHHQIKQVIMAGKVTKGVLLDQSVKFDAAALGIITRLKNFSVNSVLGAIGVLLAKEGITLIDSSTFLKSSLCPSQVLTRRKPTPVEQEDVRIGMEAARAIAALDIGQTVIVKRRVIVAVEALEGTDAAIKRAFGLAGEGLVVVKMASPDQDRRFDLPVIGMDTLRLLAESGVTCLAVEAGVTLLLEKQALLEAADDASLCVMGVTPPGTSS